MKKLAVIVIFISLCILFSLSLYENTHKIPASNDINVVEKPSIIEAYASKKTVSNEVITQSDHLDRERLFQNANNIRICRRVPKTQSELDTWAERAHANDEYYEIIDSMHRKFKMCLGIADRDGPYVDMLIEAAEKGSDKAVSLLWLLGDVELVDELKLKYVPRDEQVSRRQAFIATKYRLAHKVALQGGESSMLKLISGFQHLDPQTGGQDYVKSLAFAYFFVEVVSNSEVFGRVEWTIRDLEGKMSPEEIIQANELTRDFLAQHRAL